MSARVVGNTYAEDLLLKAKDEISKGKSLSAALKAMDLFPSMMISLFTTGEMSGSLDQMILRVADIYEEEADNAMTRLTGLLEPLMIVVMAVIIGFVVIAIIQCIYGSMGAISA
jgi:type IV pilus assembly protein PilC